MLKAFRTSYYQLGTISDYYPLATTIEEAQAATPALLFDEDDEPCMPENGNAYVCHNGALKFDNNAFHVIAMPPQAITAKAAEWFKEMADTPSPVVILCSPPLSHTFPAVVATALDKENLLQYLKRRNIDYICYAPSIDEVIAPDNATFLTTDHAFLELETPPNPKVIQILYTFNDPDYDSDEAEAFWQWAKTHAPTGLAT